MTLAATLADLLSRWGAMMASPLHAPAPVPRAWETADESFAWHEEFARTRSAPPAREEPPLLPSTDYRTNPRPVQVPVAEREPTLDALRAGLLARGPRGDALRAAVVRAMVKDIS